MNKENTDLMNKVLYALKDTGFTEKQVEHVKMLFLVAGDSSYEDLQELTDWHSVNKPVI